MSEAVMNNAQVALEEDTLKDKYLTFSLDSQQYAFELKYVIDIIGISTMTSIPKLPSYIKGVINLRGKILPIVDLRLRFGKEEREYNDRTCVIVVDLEEVPVGLVVDSVSEVVAIPQEDVAPPPSFESDSSDKYISGIGKVGEDIKLILDCERVLNDRAYSDTSSS